MFLVALPSCSTPVTFEILRPGSLTHLDGTAKEIFQVQNLMEVGYTNKDEAGRKSSSESNGNTQESNNNEEDSKPTVLVQIENTKNGGSNRLDGGRGGRKVVTGSKRTTSHIVWESDYVITSEWKIETDCKKPKLNGTANQPAVNVNVTDGQNCIPKRVTKGTKKVSSKKLAKTKEAKKAKEELSESKLDNDLENYFIASKKKKAEESAEDNKMEVDEPVVEDVSIAPSSEEKSLEEKSESGETETEKMETDESEKDKEQLVDKEQSDDKEQWSDKWSDGKKDDSADPLTEEEEQTLLDEGTDEKTDGKSETEMPDCKKPDGPTEEVQEEETPEEPSSAENESTEPQVQDEKVPGEPTKDTENTTEENSKEAPEETPAETSADSLPPLEDADASTNQPDGRKDGEDDAIPWQRIVKVSIPEEAIGKTQIRQQDLINKIGKKNYDGKVYYEKGQTEAYLLVTESAKNTVAAMTENPGI